jgi:hypothetical protein
MAARRYILTGRRTDDRRGRIHGTTGVVALLLAVATFGPSPTPAAEPPLENDRDAPVVLGRREKTQWLRLDPARFTLDVLVQYQHDSISQPGGKEEASTLSIEETVTAATTGYIVHPNLVELDLSGTFGLAQRFFDNSTGGAVAGTSPGSQSENDILYAWDARAVFLRNQIAPVTLYTQRSQQNVSQDFGPTLQNTSTTYGLTWDYRDKSTPMRLNAYHREQDQQGVFDSRALLTRVNDFHLRQDTVELGGQRRITDHQSLAWQYTYSNVDQTSADFGSDKFDSHDASASYSAEFGKTYQHTFYSTLSYLTQSGDFAQDRLRFDDQLHLRHTPRFETDCNYTYTDDTIQGQRQTSHRATASFRHRLYESLITSGQAGVQLQDFDGGGSTNDHFATLSWTYTKQVPLGLFGADLALAYDLQDNSARTAPVNVADEPHVFTDPIGVVINQRSVVPSSIRITDRSGLILFRPNLDYLVVPFADRTEIRRVPTGLLPEGAGVLVDYALAPEPASTDSTTGFGVGARYTFERGPLAGLSLFARYFLQDQRIDTDQPDLFVPNDITETTVGIDYRLGDFTLAADHVWHDSTLDPYEATHVSVRFARRFRADTTLAASVAYSVIDYEQSLTNHIDLLTIAADVEHRFNRNLRGRITLLYRDENDSALGKTRGLEETFELRWQHRQTQVYVLFRNANYQTDTQDREFQFLQVGLRRDF